MYVLKKNVKHIFTISLIKFNCLPFILTLMVPYDAGWSIRKNVDKLVGYVSEDVNIILNLLYIYIKL